MKKSRPSYIIEVLNADSTLYFFSIRKCEEYFKIKLNTLSVYLKRHITAAKNTGLENEFGVSYVVEVKRVTKEGTCEPLRLRVHQAKDVEKFLELKLIILNITHNKNQYEHTSSQ